MQQNKVIVFGGSGFLGSHVCDSLSDRGYRVTIFDQKKSPFLRKNQDMIEGDILESSLVGDAVSGNDIVYNFAGISDIDECHRSPVDTVRYNILGNALILDAAIKHGVKKYLFSSSAYVYSSAGSYYKISKQASEMMIESSAKENGINYVIMRYGSLYGERSDNRNSIYKIVKEALIKKKLDYYGDGSEIREFIHVKDAAELSIDVLENKYNDQILMLTGTKSMKYRELLDMINEILNNDLEIVLHPKRSDTHYKISPYSYNPRTAMKLINNPHMDFGQGLLNLIETINQEHLEE